MAIKRSFLKALVRIRRLIGTKKRIEKRRAVAIGGKAKRTITVTDPKALAELKRISSLNEKELRHAKIVLTHDKKVFLLYGKRAPTKPMLLSEKKEAFKVVRNILEYDRVLTKKGQ